MNSDLFRGELVRLVAPNSKTDADSVAAWSRDSEFVRLFGMGTARPWTPAMAQRGIEDDEAKDETFVFHIRTLADDRLIGVTDLEPAWTHGDGWIGIGIGERAYWGRGYGTDAMRVMLRYAFTELNLYRISLNVFDYNVRAIRSYEKVGFVLEGRQRQAMRRDGRCWDMVFMSILRDEWKNRMTVEVEP